MLSIFQFHKGAIRTYRSTDERAYMSNFNSIKVRLERGITQATTRLSLFQFHKGAIRTDTSFSGYRLFLPFQFHKGAIRTIGFVKRSAMLTAISIP